MRYPFGFKLVSGTGLAVAFMVAVLALICVGDYDQKYITTNNNDTSNDGGSVLKNVQEFEPLDVEWCRRRPTWRNSADDPEIIFGDEDENVVFETCRRVLDYSVDPDHLTEEIDPVLSSTFDGKNFEIPTSDDWYDEDIYHSLPVIERPLFAKIGQCIEDKLSSGRHRTGSTISTTGTLHKPFISKVVRRRTDGKAIMAVVENALSQEEADVVLALAHCTRSNNPRSFEYREFDNTEEGGGNDTTFLSGFLQILAPGVAHRIQATAHMVWSKVGWAEEEDDFVPIDAMFEEGDEGDDINDEDGFDLDEKDPNRETETVESDKDSELAGLEAVDNFIETSYSTRRWPDPLSECGLRTIEHLSYKKWKVLGYHEDDGSDYTVLVALSDPDDYKGGKFSICPLSRNDPELWEELNGEFDGPNCLDKVSIKPKKNSAIVFLSGMNHGVDDILTPGRVMFANELWRYGHVPAMSQRPGPLKHIYDMDDDDDFEQYEYWEDEELDNNFEHKEQVTA